MNLGHVQKFQLYSSLRPLILNMLSKDIEPVEWKFHISFHPTTVWNRRPQRSFGTPQNSTICSPNPTSHPRSFYSPMLHYWGVRYHTCFSSPKDVRLSMYWLWLSVAELRETEVLDTREHDAGVFVSMFLWWTWNRTWKISSNDWLITPQVMYLSQLFWIHMALYLNLKP